PLLAGLYWRGATKEGAIASMAVGLIAAGVFGYWSKFVGSLPVHFSFYALLLSALAMIVVSLLTARISTDTLDTTRTGWFIQSPGQPSRKSSPGETLFVEQDTPRQH
ncbi:MAG: sodium:solute symporter family protein, partial [Methanoculleus sp.]|nr:sodium:solute symporter family protein [Methanoculleus sp.]